MTSTEAAEEKTIVERLDDVNPWDFPGRTLAICEDAKAEIERLQARNVELEKNTDWKCAARGGGYFGDRDCNWPGCGCDPHAEPVISGLREHGFMDPDQVEEFEKEIREETKSEVERLQARVKELELDVRSQEMLQVSCYHAGMKFGWNCCDARDVGGIERYDAAMASTKHVAELKRIREARSQPSGG